MEYFDICDEKGTPTGEIIERSKAHELGIRHRTAHIWVTRKKENGDGYEVLLQKRALNKDSFPGLYDTSSAGHILAGDEPQQSALRELSEELGIEAAAEQLRFLDTFDIRYSKVFHGKNFEDNEIAYVYLYEGEVSAEDLKLQEEEIESVAWFDLEDVWRRIQPPRDSIFCIPYEGLQIVRNKLCPSIYGDRRPALEETMNYLLSGIDDVRKKMTSESSFDPVEHCLARIKSEESMREKCRRKGIPETTESALEIIHDAVGIRVVCAFIQDVYTIRDALVRMPEIEIVEEKDYIRHVKPNGYRSYHMILRHRKQTYAEIQLRTISMDTWAALEHHLKYKKQVNGNEDLIVAELKRCASELASTDLTMQTLRDMILMQADSDR